MTEHDRQERTDDLEAVIHSTELLQQTGILNLVRAKGGVRELAHLVFLQGQVVEASAGSRVGQDALNWVITWGSCRYTFDVRFPSEIVVLPPSPLPPVIDETSHATSPLGFISQMVQKYAHIPDSVQSTEEAAPEVSGEKIPSPPFPLPLPTTPIPAAYPLNSPTPLPSIAWQQIEMPRPGPPFRLLNGSEAVNYMERFGLSRLHRHVFFLLDGQRTVVDVVRLTGRSFHEIQHLVADLERLGLIGMERTWVSESINGM